MNDYSLDNLAEAGRGSSEARDEGQQDSFRRGAVAVEAPESHIAFRPKKKGENYHLLSIIRCYGSDGITKSELKSESGDSYKGMNKALTELVADGSVAIERREESGRTKMYYVACR